MHRREYLSDLEFRHVPYNHVTKEVGECTLENLCGCVHVRVSLCLPVCMCVCVRAQRSFLNDKMIFSP